ncbi:MAG: hypothetical protein KJ077_25125 [Anaerolineae bacterium]|nr:hypothetical protein [Anaerolineae bacterium]
MKPVLAIFAITVLLSCSTSRPVSNATPPKVPTPIPSAVMPPDRAFVNEVYHRLTVDDTIPDAGRQAIINLFMKKPTALFPDNTGLVLVYEIPTVPPTQEETTQAAVMLVGTAVGVAADLGIALSGVEVIFYTNTTPFIGFRAKPPWGLENVEAAPLAEELKKKMEEKLGIPAPKPTLPLSGG